MGSGVTVAARVCSRKTSASIAAARPSPPPARGVACHWQVDYARTQCQSRRTVLLYNSLHAAPDPCNVRTGGTAALPGMVTMHNNACFVQQTSAGTAPPHLAATAAAVAAKFIPHDPRQSSPELSNQVADLCVCALEQHHAWVTKRLIGYNGARHLWTEMVNDHCSTTATDVILG